ncbi:MAG: ABC transporter permease [Lachnospiraceae bacterium]|nr:ABC transporter permease [Lachnospiraceae bacterium]
MRKFMGLTKRNLLIYFKDRQSVIFSMLTSIIVLVLYMLFLKNTYIDSAHSAMKGLEGLIDEKDIDMLINFILLVGVIGSALITVPYNCLSTIVNDKENKIDYDISATPLKRWQIVLSYFVASTISAFIMSAVVLTIGFLVLSSQGDMYIPAENVAYAYALTFLGSLSATAFFMLIIIFFKSSSASGAFFGMLSAACGFVIGAYIPLSQFSKGIQVFCNFFPGTGVTVLFRNTILNGLLDKINTDIGGVDNGEFISSMKEAFNFKGSLFGNDISLTGIVWYVLAFLLVCIVAMVLVYPKVYKRK